MMAISDARLNRLRDLGKKADSVISLRNELQRVQRELTQLQAKKTSLQTKLAEAKQGAEDDLGNV